MTALSEAYGRLPVSFWQVLCGIKCQLGVGVADKALVTQRAPSVCERVT